MQHSAAAVSARPGSGISAAVPSKVTSIKALHLPRFRL